MKCKYVCMPTLINWKYNKDQDLIELFCYSHNVYLARIYEMDQKYFNEIIFLSTGLVLPAATGDSSAIYQHLTRHHVLQAPHVASAPGARAPFSMRHIHTRH